MMDNIIVTVLLLAALVVQTHHYFKHRYWFDKGDFDCHEIWFIGLVCMASGVAIGLCIA